MTPTYRIFSCPSILSILVVICGGFENCVVEMEKCFYSGVEISEGCWKIMSHSSVSQVLMVVYFLAAKLVCFAGSTWLRVTTLFFINVGNRTNLANMSRYFYHWQNKVDIHIGATRICLVIELVAA